MDRRIIVLVISMVLFIGLAGCKCPQCEDHATLSGPKSFKAVHMVNLNSDEDEKEFMEMLTDCNQGITDLGFPDSKYRVWKERGDRDGMYKYTFESFWPNQVVYDKVHNSEKFIEFRKKYNERFKAIMAEDQYNRYVRLN